MGVTNKLNLRANQKEKTQGDFPFNPKIVTTDFYGPVTSTASQTVINLTFSVDQSNKANFSLFVNGQLLSEGASNDYTFTNIAPDNTSSQITLTFSLTSGLNIIAVNRNLVIQTEPSNSSLQAQISGNLLQAQTNYRFNRIYNPEGSLMQRIDPVGGTSVANNVYGADRWKIQASSNNVTVQRVATSLISNVRWGMQLKKATATGFFGQAQFLEAEDTIPLIGQTVTFGVSAYSPSSLVSQIRISILSWSGTADAPTTNIISSWASQPSYVASITQIGTATLNLSASSATGTVSAVVPVGCNNLILLVHTTNSQNINDSMILSACTLNIGSTQIPYVRRKAEEELALCQRYYEKTYAVDTVPGTATTSNRLNYTIPTAVSFHSYLPLKVNKIAVPVLTFYNPNSGATGTFRDITNSSDRSVDSSEAGTWGLMVAVTPGSANATLTGHFTVDADF